MTSSKKRLQEIIKNDRLLLSSDTAEMICYDLKKTLLEYFNLEGGVSLSVEPKNDCYEVTIKTKAVAIKSFGVIK